MPLPEQWTGVFYDKDTSGDLIFDLTPFEFIARLVPCSDAPFLLAGALFDLQYNDDRHRFQDLMVEVKEILPNNPWPITIVLYETAAEMRQSGVSEKDIGQVINNTMAKFFAGGIIVRTDKPRLD